MLYKRLKIYNKLIYLLFELLTQNKFYRMQINDVIDL